MFLFRIGPLSAVLVTRLKGTRNIVNNLTFLWFHFTVVAKWHFCFLKWHIPLVMVIWSEGGKFRIAIRPFLLGPHYINFFLYRNLMQPQIRNMRVTYKRRIQIRCGSTPKIFEFFYYFIQVISSPIFVCMIYLHSLSVFLLSLSIQIIVTKSTPKIFEFFYYFIQIQRPLNRWTW